MPNRESYWLRFLAKLLAEVGQVTTRDMQWAGLLFVACYTYKAFFGGGVSWRDVQSIVVPALWVACFIGCWLTIKAAKHLRREDLAAWNEYRPLIQLEGELQRPKKPPKWKGILTSVTLILTFASFVWITFPAPEIPPIKHNPESTAPNTTQSNPNVSQQLPKMPPPPKKNPRVKSAAHPLPPDTTMEVFSGDRHKPGSKVYGIPWRGDLMDLWMTISNNSGIDYKDFYMSIEGIAMEESPEPPPKGASLGFYEIAQTAGLTEFRTQLYGEIRVGVPNFEPPSRPIDGLNLENTVRGVKADCPRFPAGSMVRFIIALTNVRNAPGPKFKPVAAGVEYRFTAKGERSIYRVRIPIRDMDNTTGNQKRSDGEIDRLHLVPGTASGVGGNFSIR